MKLNSFDQLTFWRLIGFCFGLLFVCLFVFIRKLRFLRSGQSAYISLAGLLVLIRMIQMMIPGLDLLVCFLCLPVLLNDILCTIVKAVLVFRHSCTGS